MGNLKDTTDTLFATLTRAQEERDKRPNLVDGPDGPECQWAAYERTRMHDAVNAIRADLGRAPVPMPDVLHAERQAVGHSDYSRKYALYCAELATAA